MFAKPVNRSEDDVERVRIEHGGDVGSPIREPVHLDPDQNRKAGRFGLGQVGHVRRKVLGRLAAPEGIWMPVGRLGESMHVFGDGDLVDGARPSPFHVPPDPPDRAGAAMTVPSTRVAIAGLNAVWLQMHVVVGEHPRTIRAWALESLPGVE